MAVSIVLTRDGTTDFDGTGSAGETVQTWTSQPIGTAAEDRIVVFAFGQNSSIQADTVTIGGITATLLVKEVPGVGRSIEIWAALIPAGTTTTIVATFPVSAAGTSGLGIWSVTGADTDLESIQTASNTAVGTSSVTVSIDVVAEGGVLAAAFSSGGLNSTWAWTGATEEYEASEKSTAHELIVFDQTGRLITVTKSQSSGTPLPRLAAVSFPPAPEVITLTADHGSFVLDGQAASLSRQALLPAEPGTLALTGQAATLSLIRRLAAEQGHFSLIGQPAEKRRDRRISAGSGALVLTGQDAHLGPAFALDGEFGAFSFVGQDADLIAPVRLIADALHFRLAGQPAYFTWGNRIAPPGSGDSKKHRSPDYRSRRKSKQQLKRERDAQAYREYRERQEAFLEAERSRIEAERLELERLALMEAERRARDEADAIAILLLD